MKFYWFPQTLILVGFSLVGWVQTSIAHEIFQDVLKEKYALKSFSCKTCHQDADNRKLRTPFAELYYQEMKADNWSAKFAAAEAKGEEAVAAFEIEVAAAFKKSVDKVGQATLTVDDLFAAGLLAGVRVDEKKRKALEQNQKSAAPSDSGKSESAVKSTPGLHKSAAPEQPALPEQPAAPGPESPQPAQISALIPKTKE